MLGCACLYRYLYNTIWNLGIKAAKTRDFEACSELFLGCAQFCHVEQMEGLKRTKLNLVLGAETLVLYSKQLWHHNTTEEGKQAVVANLERALACVRRCRSLMMRSVSTENESEKKEDSGLPHLAVLECRALCFLIDVTETDHVEPLTAVLHAAEELQSASPKCFVQVFDVRLCASLI